MKTLRFINKEIPASLIKRGIAYLIDILILEFVILYPITSRFNNLKNFSDLFNNSITKDFAGLTVIIILLTLCYFVLFEYLLTQTIGKMVFNINVRSVEGELKLKQVLLRNITKPFSLILLIDVAYMLFKRGHQRLFDVFSNTIVVEKGVVIK